MILDGKKRGVDSFNGASSSQDTVNSCKLKSTCPDKMFSTRIFFYKASLSYSFSKYCTNFFYVNYLQFFSFYS
jgi:hypothetical protein